MDFDLAWQQALRERRQQDLLRERRTLESPQGAEIESDGRALLNFCSNDYLGLANHPRLREAAAGSLDTFGFGAGASHLVCGHSAVHRELERALAAATGRERALLFSTGYMANLGTLQALLGRGDAVFQDRLNHASLLDGGRLCGARFQRFAHSDPDDLERRLRRSPSNGLKLICVDGVFSMDGDIAPLPELVEVAVRHDALLMVDDAHGFGVLGAGGGGTLEHFGLSQGELPVLMGTLGKALGSFGAFVAGSEALIETLIQFARSYIYTTALPPAVAAASLAGVQLLREEPWRRARLQQNIAHFRRAARATGLELRDSQTAIQPLVVGEASSAVALSERLRDRGFLVGAIRPPTVPAGTARLRIALSAAHSEAQITRLVEALAAAGEGLLPRGGCSDDAGLEAGRV